MDLYQIIKKKYPDQTNATICGIMGVAPGSISDAKMNKRLCLSVVKWMSENHPDCADLYKKALAKSEAKYAAGRLRRSARRKIKRLAGGVCNWPAPVPTPKQCSHYA